MPVKRLVAKKVRLSDIVNGRFFFGNKEELKPAYVITPFGEVVSRVNVLGTVVKKYQGDGNYSNITIDDGSEQMGIRVFENAKILDSVEVGDMAVAVGKVREYNNERYVSGEIVNKITDANYESYRRLEVLDKMLKQKKAADELKNMERTASREELVNYAKQKYGMTEEMLTAVLENTQATVDYKSKILELINALDSGSGVEIPKIFELSKLPEHVIEAAVNELLEEGSLYEPLVGRLKKV